MVASNENPGVWYKRLCAYLWYDFIYLLYISILSAPKEIFRRAPILDVDKMEKRTGQVAVITGGPRGLALGLVKRLVQLDYTIIMGVRDVDDSERRIEKFAEANKKYSFKKIKFLEMDLKNLNSIRGFADKVLSEVPRVDLLLCNAAIMRPPFEITVDGYESQFQVNYLSNFLLSNLLLERIKETVTLKGEPCQIIYTSTTFYKYGNFDINELEKPIVFTPSKFYYRSKLYPVMDILNLQKKLDNENAQVYCYAVHPGVIPTDLWYTAGGYLIGTIGHLARRFFRTVENGADTILWPALSGKYLNEGGLYMESGSSYDISIQAKNQDAQAILHTKSLKLCGISKA